MERIKLLKNQLSRNTPIENIKGNLPLDKKIVKEKKKKEIISSAYDYLDFDEFLTPPEVVNRKKLREYLEGLIPQLHSCYEKQEFPLELVKKFFADFPGLIAMHIKGHGSAEISFWYGISVLLELSRIGKK